METRTCSRCLLGPDVPGVTLAEDGLCSVCHDHDRRWGNWEATRRERAAALDAIFDRVRRKGAPYDVLVPLSGGKDSVYVLYLCRKQYNLSCLAVTLDNGFLSDHARGNIEQACRRLGVDHVMVAPDPDRLLRLYAACFRKTGFLCPVCLRTIGVAIERLQLAYGIPLRVEGTALRTEEHVAPDFFVGGELDFIENVFADGELEEDLRPLLEPVGSLRSPPSLRLPDYVEWNYGEIFATITRELGWRADDPNAEHSDCRVEDVVQYVRRRRFPTLTREVLRFSKLATCGQMTRDEAARAARERARDSGEPASMEWFLAALGLTREEFDRALADPRSHLRYRPSRSRTAQRVVNLKRRLRKMLRRMKR